MQEATSIEPEPQPATYEEARSLGLHKAAEIVARFPGSTSRELAQLSGYDRTKMARRLPEAEAETWRRRQLVWQGYPRKCKVTGRMAITWWDREVPR